MRTAHIYCAHLCHDLIDAAAQIISAAARPNPWDTDREWTKEQHSKGRKILQHLFRSNAVQQHFYRWCYSMLFRWMLCRDWMNISSIIVWDLWYYIVLEVHWQDSKSNWMNQWYSLHRTPRAHYGILCGVAHGPSTNTVGRQHLRLSSAAPLTWSSGRSCSRCAVHGIFCCTIA